MGKEFNSSLSKHINFLTKNIENQENYNSKFSKILQEMNIFESEDEKNEDKKNEDEQDNNLENDDQNQSQNEQEKVNKMKIKTELIQIMTLMNAQ